MSNHFGLFIAFLLAFTSTACGAKSDSAPDAAAVPAPPFEHCYGGSLPTCDHGEFHYVDELCYNFGSPSQLCTGRGDNGCYPFCGDAGECPAGSTCGCLTVYRCTHHPMTIRACTTSGAYECPSPDAGIPDTGL